MTEKNEYPVPFVVLATMETLANMKAEGIDEVNLSDLLERVKKLLKEKER